MYKRKLRTDSQDKLRGFGKENQRQHVEFGKPLVRLAALPKERYINFVDAYLLCLGVFKKVRNEGSRRSAVRAEPIKEHETVDMKLAHSFSKVRACIGLEFE